jgi:hypothetical protein
MATFGGAGAGALSDLIAIAFPLTAGDGSIPDRAGLDQPNVEALLKAEVQNSPGWQSAHQIGYGELLAGVPFVPNLIFSMADMLVDMTPLGPFVSLAEVSNFFTSGASTLFGGLIPGLDASKIVSGTLGASIIQPLIDAISQGFGGGDGFDFGDLTDFLGGLVFGGDVDWGTLFEGVTGQSGDIDDLISLLSGGLFGNIDPGRISFVPTGAIGTDSANLFDNPGFDGGIAFQELYGWTRDDTFGHVNTGCAKIEADGQLHTLYSNPIAVDVNQTIPMGGWIHHENLVATPGQNALQFAVAAYEGVGPAAGLLSEDFFAGILSPSGDSSNPGENDFIHVEDTYTVPAGVDEIRMVCRVMPAATSGTVRFDDGHAQTTRLLPIPFIDGLPTQLSDLVSFGQGIVDNIANALGHAGSLFGVEDLLDFLGPGNIPFTNVMGLFGGDNIGTTVQDFIDVGVQALLGGTDTGWFLDDWKTALTFIPGTNVLGAGGIDTIEQTFYTMWDAVASALRLDDLFGISLPDLASAAQDTSFSALNASILAGAHEVLNGIRTNRPVAGAPERTSVANFDVTQLGTGTDPTNFAVTQAASAIGTIRMAQADTKAVVYWRSKYTAPVTGFYINFGELNLDGSVTHIWQTPNLASQLTTTWSWDAYQFSANKFTHDHSTNIVVEFIVVGAGSVTIAGQDFQWFSDGFPSATTKRLGATRNTAGAHPDLTMNVATMNAAFTTKTPWVALGRDDVPLNYHPPESWKSTVAGAFAYPIPEWARVAGTLIDYWAVGGGGGGQSGGYFAALEGGTAGQWIGGTLTYGTDIPLGTTQLTGNVGDNALGGWEPFTLMPGQNGNATTITGLVGGFSTKTAAGGLGGGQSGNNWGQAGGQGAGNKTVAGITQQGGAAVGVNQEGARPGGGGGSGYPAVGRDGAEGQVFFRARQP